MEPKWMKGLPLIREGKGPSSGELVRCAENVALVLQHAPELIGAVVFDEFSRMTWLIRPVDASDMEVFQEDPNGFRPRPLEDRDVTSFERYFDRNGMAKTPSGMIQAGLEATARLNAADFAADALQHLEWDHVPRVDSWLMRYLGAEECEYHRLVGCRWLISLVARTLKPGCKADHALILEGRQGVGKSSVFRILAGSERYSDGLPDLHSKDAAIALVGKSVVEFAELSALSRNEVEVIKGFITREEDRYRPPYAKMEVTVPRRCVFSGTTNATGYLRDETGNRRFWPVRVGSIDLRALEEDRNMLLAEAVHRFCHDEIWWMTPEEEELAKGEQAMRLHEDPWASDVIRYIAGKAEVSVKELMRYIGIDNSRQDRQAQNRIVAILRTLSWNRDGQFSSGDFKGCARYVPDVIP